MESTANPRTLNDYQDAAGKYQVPHAIPEERVMGILEEAGELAGVFKRLMRGDYTLDTALPKLKKELGDILWYLSRIAADNNWTLEEVANENINKLESRLFRNKIMGEGDNR